MEIPRTPHLTPARQHDALIFQRLVLFLVFAVGCAKVHGPQEPLQPIEDPKAVTGEVTVWAWNIAAKGLREVLPRFEKEYPNVKVEINMTGAQMLQRLLTSLAAGVGAPDVAQLETPFVERFTITGRLMDLTPVILPYKDNFVDWKWPPCIYNGKIYAVPWDSGPALIFYRHDVLEKAGIDMQSIRTWDEFIQAGEDLLRLTNGAVKMIHLYTAEVTDPLVTLTRQLGGGFFDSEGRITIHHAPVRRALATLCRMVQAGICHEVRPYLHEHYASLNDGTVACHMSGVWMGGQIRDVAPKTEGLWGVARLPAFVLDEGALSGRSSNDGGSTLAITNQCRYPQAAWAFIKAALCTRHGQLTQYRTFDLFPSLRTVYDDPFFDEPLSFFHGRRVRRLAVQVAEEVPFFKFTSDWLETEDFINSEVFGILKGQKHIDEGLNDLAEILHRKLSRPIAPEPESDHIDREAA